MNERSSRPDGARATPAGGVVRRTSRRALLAGGAGLMGLGATGALGCGGDVNLVPVTATPIDPEMVDRDPLALLPSKAIILAGCDAKALYATSLGHDVTQIVREIVPLGAESGFEPSRDVDRITAGVYAMQGADIAAVVQGRFDADAIGKAAEAKQTMPSGKTIVKTTYGGQTMYTVGNLGFVVLTSQTMLSGNEIGMRRALDRLRYWKGEGPLPRAIDGWMLETIDAKAHLALAGDFETSSIGEATTQAIPMVVGLKRAKIHGTFQSPGLSLSGTLAYKDETSADQSAASMRNLTDVGLLGSLIASVALGAAIPQIDARRTGTDLAVSTTIDEPTSRYLLKVFADAAKAQL